MIALSPTAILSVLVPISAAVALAGFVSRIRAADYWLGLDLIRRGHFGEPACDDGDRDLV